jgi:phospholipase/carboxylesterase
MTTTLNILGYKHKYLPANSGDDSPTLLLLHGTGGNEDDLVPLAQRLAPTANLLSPRGNVLENGMPRFFRRIAEGVLDFEDLKFRTGEMVKFLENASSTYLFNPAKVIAFGYSNGANIAASLLWNYSKSLAGAILIRPMMAIEPVAIPDLSNIPVFISGGIRDRVIPSGDPQRLAELLKSADADLTLSMRDAGHEITREELIEIGEWWNNKF